MLNFATVAIEASQKERKMFIFLDDMIDDMADGWTVSPELERMERALRLALEAHPKMTVSALITLMYIARNQKHIFAKKISIQELAVNMEMPYTSLISHVKLFSGGIEGDEGLRLIDRGISMDNPKLRIVRITEEGTHFLQLMDSVLKS